MSALRRECRHRDLNCPAPRANALSNRRTRESYASTSSERLALDRHDYAILLAICVPVTSPDDYRRYALPGIDRVLEVAPDTVVLAPHHGGSYQRAVNGMLDELAARSDLDAAVVIHQDVELLNADIGSVLQECFADPRLAIVGTLGGRGRSGLTSAVEPRGARVELANGVLVQDPGGVFARVSAVDGALIGLSPWAVKNLRCDPRFEQGFHGYDMDLCLQARAHGKLIAVADLPIRHANPHVFRDGRGEAWVAADLAIRRKWDLARAPAGMEWTLGPDQGGTHQG